MEVKQLLNQTVGIDIRIKQLLQPFINVFIPFFRPAMLFVFVVYFLL